ncbi:2-C-methyl-D-erythritol 4-phosphate cytidylyltransferase [Colwellia sp. MB02u-6]|uniref:2-C-methyl-D-erythritol 4-phosphate cytidylyltransferase n=1 Tax=Colwellia sp. MB02u-6 TaxID=2759824 RepID=UPI0015F5E799|nr:2-C-methyl-D-erythritol 4-phosphate cytidylyltransferase [Colwellia sp. MB02u-6]MBA6328554.1 2-C-methyl-D-erythritol 4-phosphate cytidylyltransferase [Colwellia sp. MB02u-6]
MSNLLGHFTVVVPAAGVGKRMRSSCPKQYLTIENITILEHTVQRLLSHEAISHVIIALGENDEYFPNTRLVNHKNISCVVGGKERVDSVLAGLKHLHAGQEQWVLVHDAARPCVRHEDLTRLINYCLENDHGGLLASPVRDTMKQANIEQLVVSTLDRSQMWHALTPQMYKTFELTAAITEALAKGISITDESSAMEASGFASGLVNGSNDNIKITQPEDLFLAEFILNQQNNNLQSEVVCE